MVKELDFLFNSNNGKQQPLKSVQNKGKYVISCIGISSKKTVYLQRKGLGGYWTQYIENALVFDTYQEAFNKASLFKYNNVKPVLYKKAS